MGYGCGMPVIKLDRCNHPTPKSRKNSGNANAVVKECLPTEIIKDGKKVQIRYCQDEDYNPDLTGGNMYCQDDGYYDDADKLLAHWHSEAGKHKVKCKDGKEKEIRSDVGIGFTGVVKPELEYMQLLSYEQQLAFFNDASDILRDMYAEKGMIMEFFVIQIDEGNIHAHYGGHDPDYQLGKKLGLPFKSSLNTEFPRRMREKGWDLKDLSRYQKGKPKSDMPHGLDSKSYKYWKDTQKKELQLENEKALFEGYKADEMERLKKMEDGVKTVSETSKNVSRMNERPKRVGYAPWE